jgi:hypothetical protein
MNLDEVVIADKESNPFKIYGNPEGTEFNVRFVPDVTNPIESIMSGTRFNGTRSDGVPRRHTMWFCHSIINGRYVIFKFGRQLRDIMSASASKYWNDKNGVFVAEYNFDDENIKKHEDEGHILMPPCNLIDMKSPWSINFTIRYRNIGDPSDPERKLIEIINIKLMENINNVILATDTPEERNKITDFLNKKTVELKDAVKEYEIWSSSSV